MKKNTAHCERMRNLLILQESGELTAGDAEELARHLDNCAECKAFRSDMTCIVENCRTCLPEHLPSDNTVNLVLEHARSGKPNIIPFVRYMRTAAGIAALFAVMLSVFFLADRRNASSPSGSDSGSGRMEIILALASGGEIQAEASVTADSEDEKLQALSKQLLLIQGFGFEETADPDDVTGLFMPTALLSRNNPSVPA